MNPDLDRDALRNLTDPRRDAAMPNVRIRPVRARDASALGAMIRDLSPLSRLRRFHAGLRELPPDLLMRFTHPLPIDELALVATTTAAGRETCIAEARYALGDGPPDEREFALVVADGWQGRGIARQLLCWLLQRARRRGVARLYGDVMRDNRPMLGLADSFGFARQRHPSDVGLVRVAKTIEPALPFAAPSEDVRARVGLFGRSFARAA